MMGRSLTNLLWQRGWAIFVLRLLLGFGFAAHGYAKLERGPAQFATVLDAMGVFAPAFVAWLVIVVELAGGVSLMAGAYVSPLCAPMALIMLTAMVQVHLPYGFSSIKLRAITSAGAQFGPPGYELNLLYLAALLVLAASPHGRLSIDAWRSKRRNMLRPLT